MSHSRLETLAEQIGIDAADIAERKALLDFTDTDVTELRVFSPAAQAIADLVADAFYERQLQIREMRQIIGDMETLERLGQAMHGYVLDLFAGDYGEDYVAKRLRIGMVHARIGVAPKYYVSSMHLLKRLINEYLMKSNLIDRPPASLEKLIQFDLQLVFDTYIYSLIEEVRTARRGHHGQSMLSHKMHLDEDEWDADMARRMSGPDSQSA